jgi:hypothetical protein
MSDEITKTAESVAEVIAEPTITPTEVVIEPVAEPAIEPTVADVAEGAELAEVSIVEPAIGSTTEIVINNQTPEIKTVETTPEEPIASSPVASGEMSEAEGVSEPAIIEPTPEIAPVQAPQTSQQEVFPTPISNSKEPILETSHSSLEPNPRPYSLDPKLNKMIEGFVRSMNKSKENLILAQKAVKAKMMKKVYRIMDLFKRKKSIKNDDVEKFLHTSDETATRYLNILTKEGKIKRQGNPHSPHYTKVE